MGKKKRHAEGDANFVPKISTASRKIAARRLEQLSPSGGIPHFMRDIKCKTRAPLAPISQNPTTGESQVSIEAKWVDDEGPTALVSVAESSAELQGEEGEGLNSFGTERGPPLKPLTMSRQQSANLDDNVFTFKPKVSSASVRIVENMGTDFMARQQRHLEKQKKFIEQAGFLYRDKGSSAGNLSPVSRYRKLKERGYKESDDNENLNSNSQDSDAGPPDTPTSKPDTETDDFSDTMPPSLSRNKTSLSNNLQRILDGPYANGNPDMVVKRHKNRIRAHHTKGKSSVETTSSDVDDSRVAETIPENEAVEDDADTVGSLSRSKTMPSLSRPKLSRKLTNLGNTDRLKNAKEIAERAIKLKKVFTIQGGYSAIRHSLRKRGWVEKFYRIPGPQKKTPRKRRKQAGNDDDDELDDDDDDDDDDTDTDSDNDQPKVPPWEEEDGIYGIMSRIVRNVNPTFIWVIKRDVIDCRFLTRDQMLNHYCKAGSFTTKVGLCVNMRSVPWFEDADPDSFYPRCYRLSHEEEKSAFIDDYRLTTCISILKLVTNMYMEGGACNETMREREECTVIKEGEPGETSKPFICTDPECTRSRPDANVDNPCIHAKQRAEEESRKKELEKEKTVLPPAGEEELDDKLDEIDESGDNGELECDENGVPKVNANSKKKKKRIIIPQKCLDKAIIQCEKYLMFREHDDIDQSTEFHPLSPAHWDEMIQWYYQLAHEGAIIPNVPNNILGQVESLLNRVKAKCPQYELDGMKNIWIVKPGAKSRGRGIVCYDRLEDMLKLVNSQVVRKDNKYVVQKYIERPLLVYNCKFDIRQWFLVTDWNPLTIWFYQDSYLRFCSQQFTLDDYDESIHLSNNAIQKYYKNGPRSKSLPDDNMWTHERFKEFIKANRQGNLWDELIYPGMKKAIICSLLSAQDLVEYRKSSFELYGADFMLTEDYHPWLIEINSSPSMECSTEVTSRLCSSVLEDTLKVVIDRKFDRNCDTGRFELAFKQPLVTVPPYIGINLCVDGQAVKKPTWMNTRKIVAEEPVFSPRKERNVIFSDKLVGNVPESKMSITNVRRPQSDKDTDGNNGTKKQSSNSAPVKKSTSRENNENGHSRSRKTHTQRSPNTAPVPVPAQAPATAPAPAPDKSASESQSGYCPSETSHMGTEETSDDARLDKLGLSPQPPLIPKTSTFGSGAIPTASYVASLSGKKILSRTSVSSNYQIPTGDKDRPALSVNNVESTDLKSLKAQTKGVCPLIENSWHRTCIDCGSGMNLHLDNINPFCKCRKDGIRLSADLPRAKSARNITSRPPSGYSPRPPSASACSVKCTAGQSKPSVLNSASITSALTSKKVLLRYTDGGIPQPTIQQPAPGINALPKLVRKYIGRKVGQYHELAVSQNSAIFIDTSKLSGSLSIVSHGFHR